MQIGRTSNPALSDDVFKKSIDSSAAGKMTIQGTVNKTFISLLLILIAGTFTWDMVDANNPSVNGFMIGGAIGGFIVAMITIFKKTWAPFTTPIYAILEGLFLGGLSAYMEHMYEGIVFQAIALTIGTLLCLLTAYKSGLIKVTENFKLGIVAATGGIALLYLVNFMMGFFGSEIPMINSSSVFGIGFSVVVVIIAALNLVLDFDFIENGEKAGAPKYMEWYASFGLLVTLVWLYIEILRLLAKLRD